MLQQPKKSRLSPALIRLLQLYDHQPLQNEQQRDTRQPEDPDHEGVDPVDSKGKRR